MKKIFLNDRIIISLILINTAIIFFQGFDQIRPEIQRILYLSDGLITLLFILEQIIKISHFKPKIYFADNWNKFDFIIILISSPSLLMVFSDSNLIHIDFLLIPRLARIFKFLRFIKFIPEIDKLIHAIKRAIQSSILVLIGFFIYNFIIAVLTCFMFKNIAPEFFSNPLSSYYTIFRLFTLEGWYEIPDTITRNSSVIIGGFSTAFFILIVITGGIFGISLLNSIFVDSMVSDNNDDIERKIDEINTKIDKLIDSKGNNR